MEHGVCVCVCVWVNVTPGTYFAFFLLRSQFVQWRGCWTPCCCRRHGYVWTARVCFIVIKPALLRVNTIDALNPAPVLFFLSSYSEVEMVVLVDVSLQDSENGEMLNYNYAETSTRSFSAHLSSKWRKTTQMMEVELLQNRYDCCTG